GLCTIRTRISATEMDARSLARATLLSHGPAILAGGMMSSLAELDRDKIVDLDFTSAEFRRNAHRHVAGWARRPPFYVLGNGPPQVIVCRYAHVHEGLSDPE